MRKKNLTKDLDNGILQQYVKIITMNMLKELKRNIVTFGRKWETI